MDVRDGARQAVLPAVRRYGCPKREQAPFRTFSWRSSGEQVDYLLLGVYAQLRVDVLDMSSHGVGICVPPLGMGLATLIGRKNFSAEERETGKAALVMGCVGVTEGAIPFAAADPLRVIPSIMVGSVCGAVTAALVGAQCYAGWGGLIVLPVVEGKLGYIAAVAVGAVVTAVCVNVLKSLARKNGSSTEEKEDDLDLDFEIN